jgi:sugar phosphate isomerase/epimerase
MIALSTIWFPDLPLEDVFRTLRARDVLSFELNYRLHPLHIEEMKNYLRRYGLRITSLHNVCSEHTAPLAPDDRYGNHLADLDEEVRKLSAEHLKTTAQAAQKLGAKVIVVHGGYHAQAKNEDYHRLLREARNGADPGLVRERMDDLRRQRDGTVEPYLAQLIRSLKEVCPLYPTVKFGLENRYHYCDLPSLDELALVLDEVGADNLGYWHDCGHGQMQESMGLCRHEDWLRRYGHVLLGTHLHGMADPYHDHQAPTPDNMDFVMIGRYLHDGVLKVIEVEQQNSLEAVLAGKRYLEELYQTDRLETT